MPNFYNKKNKKNRLFQTNASSKVGVGRNNNNNSRPSNKRSAATIQRLQLYSRKAVIRNKSGKIVAGSFTMNHRAGDTAIDASTGRIEPDRRWFGNTRLVAPSQLDQFRQEMTTAIADPYSVVLKRKKLPMGLLVDAAEYNSGNNPNNNNNNNRAALLEQEPFAHAFGKQSRRKRVKLDQYLVSRTLDNNDDDDDDDGNTNSKKTSDTAVSEGEARQVVVSQQTSTDKNDGANDVDDDHAGYQALLATAQKSQTTYQEINNREGIVPWGRDHDDSKHDGQQGVLDWWRHERKDDLFLKGQSKRIWGEFFKVVDCSDVILHVIDARNVPGTRCTMIERHVAKNASHKHLVFILNKIDLVPNWVAKRWMGELAKDRPTIAFHASLTHAFGKGALISLLRQFGKLHQDKKQISVGVIGYPNVGKSSVINTLISKKSCKVAPIPGETKIWQYITLFKRIALIDCPGVVVDTAGDTETDSVLKGVVRAERLECPEDFVDAILERVKREHIAAQYKLLPKDDNTWSNSTELMELIAKKHGRLRKGGDACLRSAAIMLINDFQRGRLPHYVAPPDLKDDDDDNDDDTKKKPAAPTATDGDTGADVVVEEQDLDQIGEEHMKSKDYSDGSAAGDQSRSNDRGAEGSHGEDRDDDLSEPDDDDDDAAPMSEKLIAAGEWDD